MKYKIYENKKILIFTLILNIFAFKIDNNQSECLQFIGFNKVEIPKIQWYPGHIAKAQKKLSEVINRVDLIIEVRDARIPLSTGHPHLNQWIANKKHILVINRADMIAPETITTVSYTHLTLPTKRIV